MTISISIDACLILVAAMVLGTVAHQWLTGRRAWDVAADRSYYQRVAVAGVMLVGWLVGPAQRR